MKLVLLLVCKLFDMCVNWGHNLSDLEPDASDLNQVPLVQPKSG